MKKLSLIAATLLLASFGAFAQTATTVDTFNVGVTLTSSCSVKTPTPDLAFTYTSFQVANATASGSTVFQCTRGLSATFVFDNPGGAATASAAQATGASAITAAGVVGGLQYTLSGTTSKSTTGTAATATTAGTADEYTVSIAGQIAGGQAGDAAAAMTQARTLTITY